MVDGPGKQDGRRLKQWIAKSKGAAALTKSALLQQARDPQIPGILVHNEWRGTFEEFEEAVEFGELDIFLRIDAARAEREAEPAAPPAAAEVVAASTPAPTPAPQSPLDQPPPSTPKVSATGLAGQITPKRSVSSAAPPPPPFAPEGSGKRPELNADDFLASLGLDDLKLSDSDIADILSADQESAQSTSSAGAAASKAAPRTYLPAADATKPLRFARMGGGATLNLERRNMPSSPGGGLPSPPLTSPRSPSGDVARYSMSQRSGRALAAEAAAVVSARKVSGAQLREVIESGKPLQTAFEENGAQEPVVGKEDADDIMNSLGLGEINLSEEEAAAFLSDGVIPDGLHSGGARLGKKRGAGDKEREEVAAREVARKAREKGFTGRTSLGSSIDGAKDLARPDSQASIVDTESSSNSKADKDGLDAILPSESGSGSGAAAIPAPIEEEAKPEPDEPASSASIPDKPLAQPSAQEGDEHSAADQKPTPPSATEPDAAVKKEEEPEESGTKSDSETPVVAKVATDQEAERSIANADEPAGETAQSDAKKEDGPIAEKAETSQLSEETAQPASSTPTATASAAGESKEVSEVPESPAEKVAKPAPETLSCSVTEKQEPTVPSSKERAADAGPAEIKEEEAQSRKDVVAEEKPAPAEVGSTADVLKAPNTSAGQDEDEEALAEKKKMDSEPVEGEGVNDLQVEKPAADTKTEDLPETAAEPAITATAAVEETQVDGASALPSDSQNAHKIQAPPAPAPTVTSPASDPKADSEAKSTSADAAAAVTDAAVTQPTEGTARLSLSSSTKSKSKPPALSPSSHSSSSALSPRSGGSNRSASNSPSGPSRYDRTPTSPAQPMVSPGRRGMDFARPSASAKAAAVDVPLPLSPPSGPSSATGERGESFVLSPKKKRGLSIGPFGKRDKDKDKERERDREAESTPSPGRGTRAGASAGAGSSSGTGGPKKAQHQRTISDILREADAAMAEGLSEGESGDDGLGQEIEY